MKNNPEGKNLASAKDTDFSRAKDIVVNTEISFHRIKTDPFWEKMRKGLEKDKKL